MSDQSMAALARQLADALSDFAYTRNDEDKKLIASLHHQPCLAARMEKEPKEK